MITTMQMYWLVILDNIVSATAATLVVSALAALLMGVAASLGEMPKWPAKAAFWTCVASLLVLAFTPSPKQMAAIVIVPKIVNNERVQVAGDKLYDLAIEWMDSLRPKKPKEGK